MEYTWKITGVKTIDTDSAKNAIVQTYWEKTGIDENGNKGSFSGATPFTEANIDPEKFVPYEELTEEIILSWIKDIVVGSYEEHVNSRINSQILESIVKTPSLPWAEQPAGTNPV